MFTRAGLKARLLDRLHTSLSAHLRGASFFDVVMGYLEARKRSYSAACQWGAVLTGCWLGAACTSYGRFKDAPIVWRADDQRDIAEPEELPYDRVTTTIDALLLRQLTRTLELKDVEAAHNTNALDEVPDSTWFTNRIGVRDVTPAEAALGVSAAGPPTLPIRVLGGKPGGMNPGFVAEDATGRRFVVKFDTKEYPGMQTATNTIVNRIFWTLGYNVPNDTIFRFRRKEVSVAKDAEVTDAAHRKRPMTNQDLDDTLSNAPRYSDGRYRATASEFIEGIPKGGWSKEGVRKDDPNDRVPHEHRREVRGLRVFAAWLNHADMKPDNSLDAYVNEHGKRFLKHYLLDFGEAFGAHTGETGLFEAGYEHYVDWEIQPRATFSFGLWVRPWENLRETRWLDIGSFSATHFDPEKWRPLNPYWPFVEADAADKYWAAKIAMRFTRAILRAIVKTGELEFKDAEDYLTEVLYERRRIIGLRYLEAVSPLDYFTIDRHQLCAIDLSVHYKLVGTGLVEVLDGDQHVVLDGVVPDDGRFCVPVHQDDKYRIYRLRIRRRSETRPELQVHFKAGARPRILGVIRMGG